jgi:hypothetical protein
MKTPKDGVGAYAAPHSDKRSEPWGFIKSLAQNQAGHKEFSLRLSFYLRHSLRGYMVSTTTGFSVKIMEALAPRSHRQIPWKCQQ